MASAPHVLAPAARSLTRHTAYYLVGRIATGAVGLLTLVAFTHLLSPVDYGRYAVLIAIAALIAAVGFQWLRQCLVRFGTSIAQPQQPLLGTLGALLLALLLCMVVAILALAALSRGGLLHLGVSGGELLVIAGLAAAQTWFEFSVDAARVDFRPWRYNAATLARSFLTLTLGVAAALFTRSVTSVVLAMAVAYLVVSPLATPRWLTGVLHMREANWAEARRLAVYGLPLASTLGMAFILDSADRLMLAGMRGYAEAGVYSSAYNLAQFSMGTVLAGLGLGSLPLAVGALNGQGRAATAHLLGSNLTLGIGIALPAMIGLVTLAPGLDRLLLGNNVPGRSDPVTMIVAVGIGLAALRSYCVDVVFMLHNRTWLQALIIGGAALLNVGLNWIWIPRWGAIGAAIATLMAFLVAFLGSWFLSRRYLKIPVAVADVGKIIVAGVVLALALITLPPSLWHWLRLVVAIVVGAGVYTAAILALDTADSRTRARGYLEKLTRRFDSR